MLESNDSENFNKLMSKTYSELGDINKDIDLISNKKLKNKLFNKDRRLLKGFQPKEIKEQGLIYKNMNFKMISEGELYFKNKELLKTANPIAYKLNLNHEAMDLKYLKRKLDASKVKTINFYASKKNKSNSKSKSKEKN